MNVSQLRICSEHSNKIAKFQISNSNLFAIKIKCTVQQFIKIHLTGYEYDQAYFADHRVRVRQLCDKTRTPLPMAPHGVLALGGLIGAPTTLKVFRLLVWSRTLTMPFFSVLYVLLVMCRSIFSCFIRPPWLPLLCLLFTVT